LAALNLTIAAGAAAGAILLFILLQRARELLRYRKVRRMAVNDQAQAYFLGVIKMTNYYHYPFKHGETPLMYGRRLGKRFAFKSDSIFLRDLIALYYKARYGDKPLSGKELALLRDCYFDMADFLRTVRYAPHYMFIRYVLRVTVL
jgi:hypothetical protein